MRLVVETAATKAQNLPSQVRQSHSSGGSRARCGPLPETQNGAGEITHPRLAASGPWRWLERRRRLHTRFLALGGDDQPADAQPDPRADKPPAGHPCVRDFHYVHRWVVPPLSHLFMGRTAFLLPTCAQSVEMVSQRREPLKRDLRRSARSLSLWVSVCLWPHYWYYAFSPASSE